MKKLIATAAVLACAASIVSAQTVTSANIVGYNKDVAAPGLHISGYAFTGTDYTPQGVFGGQLPLGTKVYTFNGAGYDISTFSLVFNWDTFMDEELWDPNTLDLSGAAGFWVENTGEAAATAILSGEVELAESVTNSIVIGLQLLSNPYPVASDVSGLGFTPTLDDKFYAFNGEGYDISTYSLVFNWDTFMDEEMWDPEVSVDVGEGFWYEAVAPQTWVATRPFTP